MEPSFYPEIIQIDDLTINPVANEVRVHGTPLKLTRKEFQILWAVGSNPEKVFHRNELLMLVWGSEVSVEPRTVDAHMARLRKILSAHNLESPKIETIWGIGYRLRPRN